MPVTEASPTAIADPARTPRRRVVRWIALGAAVVVVAAATALVLKVSTENAIGWDGGSTFVHGAGGAQQADPDGRSPSGQLATVTYTPSDTFELGFSVTNMSHTQSITIRSITWEDLDGPGNASALASARLFVDYDFRGGNTPVSPFHPFRLGPRQQVYIQWSFTMCAHAPANRSSSTRIDDYRIDYTYVGVGKSQTVPLALPLQMVDVPSRGC